MKRLIPLLLVSLLMACTALAPTVDPTGEWRLVSYGDASNPTPALPGVETTLSFSQGQMGGNVGCNSFGGGYTIKGNILLIKDVMSTMMFCEQTNEQEQGVLMVLQGELTMTRTGELLTLTAANGQVVNLAPRQ